MWKAWKKRINDFIFEEIDEELDYSEETGTVPSSEIYAKKYRSQAVRTKVTYEYPKKKEAPFRFPVIPDEEETVERKQDLMTNQRLRTRRKNRTPVSTASEQSRLIHGYQQKNRLNELEDVPAYIRRRRHQEIEREEREKEEKRQRKEELEQKIRPELSHTTPDELDRVFRKRDGLVERVEETVEERSKQSKKKPSFPLNEKRSLHASFPLFEEASEEVHKEETMGNDYPAAASREQEIDVVVYDSLQNDTYRITEEDLHDSFVEAEQQEVIHEHVRAHVEHQEEIHYEQLPDELLNFPQEDDDQDIEWIEEQSRLLEQTLIHFNIDAKIVHVTKGPSVTRFEIQPELGVKVSRIRNLADDIKLNMAAKAIRIEAPIPGKNTVGIEVPNRVPEIVTLHEIIQSEAFQEETSPLAIALGVTIEGKPLVTNIEKMPHGLIAGATGSGKSVCINSIILSLLYKASPDEVKLLLIDPKMVELTPYNGIPHLLAPVITDPQAATKALKWTVDEMEARYKKFVELGVRNIVKYNERVSEDKTLETMPYIVVIIDELADLMIVAPQDVEDSIARIAQKARACGIHLLLATQRPSVDVITGLIKANIPTRIAFSVSSQVDSRTIIDTNGAEKLLGKGDMLFVENGGLNRLRLQGPFVSDEEIDRVVQYVRSTGEPDYAFEQEQLLVEFEEEDEDELLEEVMHFVVEQQQASTSLLQRRFRIGYNRAARLVDTLQSMGIISAQNGTKPRDVLITKQELEQLL